MLYPDSGRNLSQQMEKISRLKGLASNEVSPASSVSFEPIVLNGVTWVAPNNGWKYIGSGKWGEITQLSGTVSPFLTSRGSTLYTPEVWQQQFLKFEKTIPKEAASLPASPWFSGGSKHVNFRGSSMVIVSRQDPGVVFPNGHFLAYEWGWS